MNDSLRHWIFDRYLPQNLKARSKSTHRQYQFAVNDFAEYLGREPTLADLQDELVAGLINHLLGPSRGVCEITANERAGRIKTFWRWAASRRTLTGVQDFPTVQRVPVPEKIPRAWREEELVKLFNACRFMRGELEGVPAWRWWTCLHAWLWATAERIGATLLLQPEHLDLDRGVASVPASIRKGKRKPAVYQLWPDVVAMLREILPPKLPKRERVFPWPYDPSSFYNHYRRLLRRANLDRPGRCGPHQMRVSHATWRHIAGDDATQALGHSSSEVTRKHYLDPSLLKQDESKLFRPW